MWLLKRLLTSGFAGRMKSLTGIDRAIGYSLVGRVIGFAGRLITIFLVLTFLSEREQGYYYTFYSVLALTMFLDLGLTNVLQVFASHEKARLTWGESGILKGSREDLDRLRSLLRIGIIWFGVAAGLVVVLMYPAGFLFFSSQDSGDTSLWVGPWLFASLVTACAVMMGPVMSILTGCGRVKEIRMLDMLQPLVGYPVSWLVFIYGGGLFAGPAFFACGLIVTLIWLIKTHSGFLRQNVTLKSQCGVSWRELWPLQWRTGINWMSGYLIFHLLNPMVFAFFGPPTAGQLGVSLMLSQQIVAIALYWVGTKSPLMGEYWARGEYKALDKLYAGAVGRMLLIGTAGCGALVLIVHLMCLYDVEYAGRMLAPAQFYKVAVVQILNTLILSESLYLRANKKEPFVWISIVQGIMVVFFSWFLGKRIGLNAMLWGQMSISFLAAASCTYILLNCRKRWQKTANPDDVVEGVRQL